MSRVTKIVLGLVLVAGFLVYGAARRSARRDDTMTRLIADVAGCDAFARHERLLAAVIEREHDDACARHEDRVGSRRARVTRFDWDGYRTDMYNAMVRALDEAGHERDAIELDRCRAGG